MKSARQCASYDVTSGPALRNARRTSAVASLYGGLSTFCKSNNDDQPRQMEFRLVDYLVTLLTVYSSTPAF